MTRKIQYLQPTCLTDKPSSSLVTKILPRRYFRGEYSRSLYIDASVRRLLAELNTLQFWGLIIQSQVLINFGTFSLVEVPVLFWKKDGKT